MDYFQIDPQLKNKKRIKMKQIYLASVVGVESEADKIIVAEDVKEAEQKIDGNTLQRVFHMDWIYSDIRENRSGKYHMVDVVYNSQVTGKNERVVYLVQAENFGEAEEIAKEECNETFEYVMAIDFVPYDVID
jgi:hypothetical protein